MVGMNEYEGVVEDWKVDLIVQRAKWHGLREHDIQDLQQEIVLDLLVFRYDPLNANGASETTVVQALIDKKIKMYKRAAARFQKHEDGYKVAHGPRNGLPASDPLVESHENRVDLKHDIPVVLSKLSKTEQTICKLLGEGMGRDQIAPELGLTRYDVDLHVEEIRKAFLNAGLNGWATE